MSRRRPLSQRRQGSALVTAATAWLVAVAAAPAGLAAQRPEARAAALDTIRRIEDLRGRGPDITPLLLGVRHHDRAVRLAAIRALGRLESPRYVPQLLPLLEDTSEVIRVRGIEAVARALRGWAGTPAATHTAMDAALIDTVVGLLRARGIDGASALERGTAARALALLPWWDARQARVTEAALMAIAAPHERPGADTAGIPEREAVAYGLYFLARARRRVGELDSSSIAWLRRQVTYGPSPRPSSRDSARWWDAPATAAATRRLAWLAMAAAGVGDGNLVRDALRDPDPQVRRLALAALRNVADSATRRTVLEAAPNDPAVPVRLEWMQVYRGARPDCGWLLSFLDDPSPHVRLGALDLLGRGCPDRSAIGARLVRLIASGPTGAAPRARGDVSWHALAHALLALATVDSALARPLVARHASHRVWQVRRYTADAAAELRDTRTLLRLAFDSIGSVREAALSGLASVAGHDADSVYLAALSSREYHVVLAAARALRGTSARERAVPLLLDALDRLTGDRRETSRDPRMELLARIDELTDRASAAARETSATRLRPYLGDFDPAVADRAAAVLDRVEPSAAPHQAAPQRLPLDPAPGAEFQLRPATHLRVTMDPESGGGTFVLRLHPDVAPAAVARVVWLARRGYYDGLTWHRVVPNFVVQGGSPAMNEYAGDGPFMRDELSLWSHRRGTVGISTRGRDTGDAQWFINLVDNFRLDPDYTIFATVEEGMEVVDGMLEGDAMQSVQAVQAVNRR